MRALWNFHHFLYHHTIAIQIENTAKALFSTFLESLALPPINSVQRSNRNAFGNFLFFQYPVNSDTSDALSAIEREPFQSHFRKCHIRILFSTRRQLTHGILGGIFRNHLLQLSTAQFSAELSKRFPKKIQKVRRQLLLSWTPSLGRSQSCC